MFAIVLMVSLPIYGFVFYMIYRSNKVFDYRTQVLFKEGTDEYRKLPSYDTMVYKFWVWPMSEFKKQDKKKPNLRVVK